MTAATTTDRQESIDRDSCAGASSAMRTRSASAAGVNGFCSSGTPAQNCAVHRGRVVRVAGHVEHAQLGLCCSSRAARFGPLRPGITTSVTSRCGLMPASLRPLDGFSASCAPRRPCSRGAAAPWPTDPARRRCPRPAGASRCRRRRGSATASGHAATRSCRRHRQVDPDGGAAPRAVSSEMPPPL